jgi:DNA-binding LytR/AlgR family response regulator
MAIKTVRILILEDDLETLSVLTNRLFKLEQEIKDKDIAVTTFSEYTQIIDYVNKSDYKPDLILLDYDCKACGSFHALNFDKFKVPIIAISTQPEYNIKVVVKGAIECRKDLLKLDEWGDKVIELIKAKI